MKNLVCDLSVASSSLLSSFVFFSSVSLSTVSLCVEKKLVIDMVVEGNRLLQDAIMIIHEQPMSTFHATALRRGYIVSRLLAVMMLIIPPGFG